MNGYHRLILLQNISNDFSDIIPESTVKYGVVAIIIAATVKFLALLIQKRASDQADIRERNRDVWSLTTNYVDSLLQALSEKDKCIQELNIVVEQLRQQVNDKDKKITELINTFSSINTSITDLLVRIESTEHDLKSDVERLKDEVNFLEEMVNISVDKDHA